MRAALLASAVACGGYLLGSISFARLVGRRAAPGADLSLTKLPVSGSAETWAYRGVSATSILNRARARWGLLVILLDALKALVPTLVVRLVWPEQPLHLLAAAAVFTGHVYPVWHRFRGGRGLSCLLGAMLVINPLLIPMSLAAGTLVGMLVFTSAYVTQNAAPFFLVPWYAAAQGWGSGLWFGLWICGIYSLAVVPDVREELRVQRTLGTFAHGWRERLRLAWSSLTHYTVA